MTAPHELHAYTLSSLALALSARTGADWFSETRTVTGMSYPAHSLSFEPSSNGVAGCNDKAYLQVV